MVFMACQAEEGPKSLVHYVAMVEMMEYYNSKSVYIAMSRTVYR